MTWHLLWDYAEYIIVWEVCSKNIHKTKPRTILSKFVSKNLSKKIDLFLYRKFSPIFFLNYLGSDDDDDAHFINPLNCLCSLGSLYETHGLWIVPACMVCINLVVTVCLLFARWSLLAFSMYLFAMSIVFWGVWLITSCCHFPLLFGLLMGNRSLFARCGQSECSVVMGDICAFCICLLFQYCLHCVFVCLLFLFVDGPSESILYLNASNAAHLEILILFIIALCIAAGTVCIVFVYECKPNERGNEDEDEEMEDVGKTVEMQTVTNDHDHDEDEDEEEAVRFRITEEDHAEMVRMAKQGSLDIGLEE